MKDNKVIIFKVGAVMAFFVAIVAILGIIWTPYDPNAMNASCKYNAPTLVHIFGCDQFGRDILSRVMKGMSSTFLVALATVIIGSVTGILVGGICGLFGGMADEIIMRFNDVVAAFPSVLIALMLISIIGTGTINVVVALGVSFVPSFARMARGEFLRQKDLDYMKSAALMKVPPLRRIFVHLLPNAAPVLMQSVIIGFNNAVLAEASMSYLGIGIQPPDASLGRMLSEAQSYLGQSPWCAMFAGLTVIIMVLSFSLLGGGEFGQV